MLKFYLEDEDVDIVDIDSMSYHEFLQHEVVLYIERDQLKKQQNHLKKKIKNHSILYI